MRVGEIDLDMNTVGQRSQLETARADNGSAELAAEAVFATRFIARAAALVPSKAWRVAAYGSGTLLVAALAAAVLVPAPLSWVFAVAVVPATFVCLVSLLMGRRSRSLASAAGERQRVLDAERGRRLIATVGDSSMPQSFDTLQGQLGWDTITLARTLAEGVEDGRVIEDLDPESQDWTYELSPTQLLPVDEASLVPLTAAQRALATQEEPAQIHSLRR
jgi:hypothetical protein